MDIPSYQARKLVEGLDLNADGKISLGEFEKVSTGNRGEGKNLDMNALPKNAWFKIYKSRYKAFENIVGK